MKKKGKPDVKSDDDSFGTMIAAVKIQKIWRGYIARRNTRKLKIAEMLLIGMIPPDRMETSARERQLEVTDII